MHEAVGRCHILVMMMKVHFVLPHFYVGLEVSTVRLGGQRERAGLQVNAFITVWCWKRRALYSRLQTSTWFPFYTVTRCSAIIIQV